jgi:hypothetical protein
MSAQSNNFRSKPSRQSHVHQKKSSDDKKAVWKNTTMPKSVNSNTFVAIFDEPSGLTTMVNSGESSARRDDNRSTHTYGYHPVQRPWMNIKRAGNETLILNASPMEIWEGERVRDQPWNVVGRFSLGPSVFFTAFQVEREIARECKNEHEEVEKASMACEVSDG